MSLKKCVIVFFVILGETCFADIAIKAPKKTDSITYLANETVKILISCYGNQVNGVGLYGDSTGILFRTLLSKQTFPVILIDSTAEVVHGSVQREFQYKLQVFTIVTCSSTQLKKIVEDIKNLPWWNHMAFFLFLCWETESNYGCSNAFGFLWVAWEMNVLNVKFLCVHPTKGVLLYTYNPYTIEAPKSWKLKNTVKGKNDHPWSTFVLGYRDVEGICEGLDFDKTRDLGGYVIPSSVKEMPVFWHINFNKTGIDSFEGLGGLVVQMSFRAMNANARLVRGSYDVDANVLVTIKNGETTGIVLDVMNGISDIVLSPYYQDKLTNLTITYPHWKFGLGVVTQKSGHVSQLGKINSVIDVDSRHGLCLVMLITPICFKYFLRQALTPAILNTVRIICNSSLLKLPMKISTRIYLATLFFFQITILALYQGQLASLLTKPVFLKNVNSMHDLADLGHTIYVHKDTASSFTDPILQGRIVKIETYDCLKYVLRDESAACVREWDILISTVTNPKLHVSRKMIVQSPIVYVIRENWPLEQRFNDILARMIETGLTRHTYTRYSDKALSINEFYEKTERLNSYKVITSSELGFAFAILGIGLGCATVTFIVETLIS